MAVWSVVNYLKLTSDLRIDSEYYQPEYLFQEKQILCLNPKALESLSTISDGNHLTISDQFLEEEDGGIRYLRGQDLTDFFISDSNPVYIPKTAYEGLKRSHMYEGDILLSIVGTIGNAALVTDKYEHLTGSCKIAIIRPRSINPYFLAAYLASGVGKAQIDRRVRGAVQQGLILPDLKDLPIPNIAEDEILEIERLIKDARHCQEKAKALYAEAEALLLHELGLDTLDLSIQKTYVANFSETVEGDRFDAEYFHPEKRHIQEQLDAMSGKPIGYYFASVDELLNPPAQDTDEKVYNYDLTHALRFFLNEDDVDLISTYDLGSTKKKFQQNDIVISRLRSYLKEIAIVKTDSKFKCVGSSEFFIFRSINQLVSPELLLVYLRSSPVQKVLKWCQDGSNHPRFKDGELLRLKFPDCLFDIQSEVQDLIHQGISVHQEAKVLLEQAKHRVEQMILGEHTTNEYPS